MIHTSESGTILAHPALAGHILVTLSTDGAIANDIQPEGRLGAPRPAESDPAAFAWRGGPAR
jgi:hypothetical protein